MEQTPARILIVDDEPSLLKMMRAYLVRIGFVVDTSATTDQAWTMVQEMGEPYSVVVIDASISGMSMEDLAMGALQSSPAVRIIAASGYPVDISALGAVAPGRVMFLHKPFTPQMLASAVRRMIAGQETNV